MHETLPVWSDTGVGPIRTPASGGSHFSHLKWTEWRRTGNIVDLQKLRACSSSSDWPGLKKTWVFLNRCPHAKYCDSSVCVNVFFRAAALSLSLHPGGRVWVTIWTVWTSSTSSEPLRNQSWNFVEHFNLFLQHLFSGMSRFRVWVCVTFTVMWKCRYTLL